MCCTGVIQKHYSWIMVNDFFRLTCEVLDFIELLWTFQAIEIKLN